MISIQFKQQKHCANYFCQIKNSIKHNDKYFTGFKVPISVVEKIDLFKKTNSHLTAIKWTKREQLHLTALYIGKTNLPLLSKNEQKMQLLCEKIEKIELELSSICFSVGDNPTMIWGSFKPNQAFENLIQELAKTLSIPLRKKIIPHIKIAQLKKETKYYKPIFEEFKSVKMKLDHLQLWKASSLKKATKYSLVNQFDFQKKEE